MLIIDIRLSLHNAACHSWHVSPHQRRHKNRPTITSGVVFSLTLELQKVGNPPRTMDDCVGESIAHPAQELQVYPYWVGVARIILEHIFFQKNNALVTTLLAGM